MNQKFGNYIVDSLDLNDLYEELGLKTCDCGSMVGWERLLKGNCIVIEDTNGNRKLSKKRKDQKIDNVSAMMDAYSIRRGEQ